MKRLITAMLVTVALAASCKSEIDGKASATVADPTPTTTAPNPTTTPTVNEAAAAASTDFDPAKSKIEWTAGKVTKDHQGGFKTFTGKVTYGADGEVTAIETEIDTTSVFTDTDKLTEHLKSEDFFDVAKFPRATFKTTKIVPGEGSGFMVSGLLDLHGVQKEITFPATIVTEAGSTVATAEFTLKRFDFGIAYKGKADDLIRDEVLMKLTVVAPRPTES